MEFSCKQTKVMFAFSVTHKNTLRISWRSNKYTEYISFLIQHLQNHCFKHFKTCIVYIHVYLSSSSPLLLAHCSIPRVCAHDQLNGDLLINKQLHRATRGQRLHREPLNTSTLIPLSQFSKTSPLLLSVKFALR